MPFLNSYNEALNTSENLHAFIESDFDEIYDYYSLSNYSELAKNRDDFKALALRAEVISGLNYDKPKNEAFLNLILRTAIRLDDAFVFEQFFRILVNEGLELSKVIEASHVFMTSRAAGDFFDGYNFILERLQEAYITEADDNKEPLAVLVNFYSSFINHFNEFHLQGVKDIRNLLNKTFEEKEYPFADDSFLGEILEVDITFQNNPYNRIKELVDQYLERGQNLTVFQSGLLLEVDTNYSKVVNSKYHTILELLGLNKRLYDKVKSNAIYNSLGRGINILEKEEQLFAYMYAYGKMHIAKLKDAITGIDKDLENINLIDWGCGQAPASKVFLETLGSDKVSSVTLIEPSKLALERASLHLQQDVNTVNTINKDFDSLSNEDLLGIDQEDSVTVHLFSNVIDMEFFKLSHLNSLLKDNFSGENYFIVVSPYINVTRTQRIESFVEEFTGLEEGVLLLSESNKSGTWLGNWSKVIRVFKTEL
ncbi:hypothetical protein [Lacinutrix jangbogonensis]|uniref:hypothetical protein n=1 Tax=Lacinutrix jangbogonensis TaxID=1469557 RepID=UPI00053DE77B|nr:hypothetical protein [Lacinutrix jangbogonensis]